MSRSCQSATFSSPTSGTRAHDPCEPTDPLGDDRVPLVRHRRRALLALAERLLHLGHLGSRQVPDLERKPLERRRGQRQRRQQGRMPVALHDLRRRRLGLEPEPLARDALDLGIDRRVVPDRAGELPDPHARERGREPLTVALELERPDGELEAERRRLGVNAVRAADRQRQPVLLGALHDRVEGAVDPGQDELAGRADLERERRVDDVRRGQPVVEPAPGGPEVARRRRRRTRPGRGGSSARSPRRAPASAPSPSSESRSPHRRARRRSPPTRRAPRARPRASARACPRPTRSWPSPVASNARSLVRF